VETFTNHNNIKLFFNGSFVSDNINVTICQEVETLTNISSGIVVKVAGHVVNHQLIFKSVSNDEVELLLALLQFNKGNINFCEIEVMIGEDKKLVLFTNIILSELYINNNQFIFNVIN